MTKVLSVTKQEEISLEDINKIIVLSDTHIPVNAAKIPDQIIEQLNHSDLIIHTGDYQTIEVVNTLEGFGNFIGVHGNMDTDEVAEKLPDKLVIKINNKGKQFKFGILHGYGPKENITERVSSSFNQKLDCILFGHSHKPFNEIINGTLLFNPGSPTDTAFTDINTFGILNFDDKIHGEIIEIK